MRRLVMAVGALAIALEAVAQSPSPQNVPTIDPAWLRADTVTRTAKFDLTAGLTGYRGALNFNGFADGQLALTVPLGWNVVMHFRNNDAVLPHSAEVIPDVKPLPLGPVDPAFDRAVTIKLMQGLQAREVDDIRFVANRVGTFIIFCAVPGHGAAGMWIRFVVSDMVRRPSLATASGGS
jgi:FtsP/CotA-like multicopper oxidase with cupredoxin domain